jgi:uncharacterized protein YndB with AHSA1/START domain
MASIYREFDIAAPVEKVWAAIADVGAPDKIINFLSNVTLEGNRRSLQLGDMGKVEELIVSIDQNHRRVAYSICESPFNLAHHNASMQALPNGRGGTRFVWITDVKPDEAAAPEVIDSAIESIKEALRS